ncbi:hypothetical protein HBB16_21515 [Pseudonocardia sp. MCCB 268]|nr:hypothetical protein [Pseudonocardia cytotoxica]
MLLGAIGLLVGRALDGELDVSGLSGLLGQSATGDRAFADPEERGALGGRPRGPEEDRRVRGRHPVGDPAPDPPVAGLGVGGAGLSAKVRSRGADEPTVRLWLTLTYPGAVRAAVAEVRERTLADLLR